MLDERGVIELHVREYVEQHGGSVDPTPLWVMATGTAPLIPPSAFRLLANAITTFPPRVPCTDDPWLWLGITMMNWLDNSSIVFPLNAKFEAGLRFTLQRGGYRFGNLEIASATGVPFGDGWVPSDILAARAGRPFFWDWPVLLEPTDSIYVEICNQSGTIHAMFPVCLYGYRFERGAELPC